MINNFEEVLGPTPSGGVKSVAYFFDDDGNPITKEAATQVCILELDDGGNRVNETWFRKG